MLFPTVCFSAEIKWTADSGKALKKRLTGCIDIICIENASSYFIQEAWRSMRNNIFLFTDCVLVTSIFHISQSRIT